MPEQPPLVGRAERRRRAELARAADVVHERRREQEVGAQPRVQLRQLVADRRHADRVLEQPAGVRVVAVGRRRDTRAAASPRARVVTSARSASSWISDARNSRNPSSSSASRRSAGASAAGSASAGSSARTSSWSRSRNFSTRPRTCTASPSPKRASSSSTSFHTRPEMRPVASRELEREVGRAAPRVQLLLLQHRVDAVDDPVLREVGERRSRE